MAEQAREHSLTAGRTTALYLDRASGTYEYRVHSSRDVDERYGSTPVYFDANTGAFNEIESAGGATYWRHGHRRGNPWDWDLIFSNPARRNFADHRAPVC